MSNRQPLQIGHTLIDRFEIVRFIAGGGFGLTYRAKDLLRGGQNVALKEYFPKTDATAPRIRGQDGVQLVPALDEPLLRAVLREEMAQDKAEHPAIAPIVKAFPCNGTAYIAMDWIEGDTLYNGRDSLRRDEPYLRKLYLTLLDAILHIDKQGLSHRDLSAGNIMVRRSDGEPVIIDFGASRSTSAGYMLASNPVGTPGFTPPELLTGLGYLGTWTDLFGLSASLYYFLCGEPPLPETERYSDGPRASLQERKARGEASVKDYSDALLAAIDRGLAPRLQDRQRLPSEVLALRGVSPDDLRSILHPEVFDRTLLLDPPAPRLYLVTQRDHPIATGVDVMKQFGYQRTLLQSFDTARFQPSSIQRSDGTLLTVDEHLKIALARTEALLSVAFGREIVVPAGQVAESPAFQVIFTEIAEPYAALADKIAAACKKERMQEPWRPFRLALERRSDHDYRGFTKNYEYTGAPLVLLKEAGENVDEHIAKGEAIKTLVKLFAEGRFEDLQKKVKRRGYGEFARLVSDYFRPDKSVFATGDAAAIASTEYAKVFRSRLGDERVAGPGIDEARQSLEAVDKVERLLEENGNKLSGLRGNWYVFQKDFGATWQLARAYLDMRLFVGLTRQYQVEHPVFISQEFEYGRFAHSLLLGPKVAAELATGKYDDDRLIRLATHFAEPIAWNKILELYTKPTFIRSIRRMNRAFYFGSEIDYFDAMESHGILLDKWLTDVLSIDLARGQFVIRAPTQGAGEGLAIEGHEPTLDDSARAEDNRGDDSPLAAFGGGTLPQDKVATRVLQTRRDGGAVTGDEMKEAVIHYFVKPYRMLAAGQHT